MTRRVSAVAHGKAGRNVEGQVDGEAAIHQAGHVGRVLRRVSALDLHGGVGDGVELRPMPFASLQAAQAKSCVPGVTGTSAASRIELESVQSATRDAAPSTDTVTLTAPASAQVMKSSSWR